MCNEYVPGKYVTSAWCAVLSLSCILLQVETESICWRNLALDCQQKFFYLTTANSCCDQLVSPRLRVQHPQPRYVLWRQEKTWDAVLSALHHICLNNPFLCLLISTGLFHFSYLWCATRLCFEALSDSVISAPSAALSENFSGHLLSQLHI